MENNFTVYTALSGGVDSAVSLALLKEKGYKVVGVYMKLWSESESQDEVKALQASEALKVCEKLKVPFFVWDFSDEFKKMVVDEFVSSYGRGFTPNPCIVCNREIKFGLFLRKALAAGADFIATGHYALLKKKKNYFALYRAKDKSKDQSYFLSGLKQEQLAKTFFPLGSYSKEKVRLIAQKLDLPVALKAESQEICFIKTGGLLNFLSLRLKIKEGPILELTTEKLLGKHRGAFYYTLGQRLPIGGSGPYFVVKKDLNQNIIWAVSFKNRWALYRDEFYLKEINWPSGQEPKLPLKARVQIRYHAPLVKGYLSKTPEGNFKVKLKRKQFGITPGQSAVFYIKNELIGGGPINDL